MEFMLSWAGLGTLAFVLALVNLIRVSGGHTAGCQAFMFGSLSCGVLALLDEYRRVAAWVKAVDMAALGDVVPWTYTMLMVACFLLLILNLVTVAICMAMNHGKRRRDRKTLAEAQKQAAEAAVRAEAAEKRAEAAEQRAADRAETPSAEEWKQLAADNDREAKEKIQAELAESLHG